MMRGIGTATAGVVLIGMMGAGLLPGKADEAKTQYPRMALVEQYTMDRNAEIAMAKPSYAWSARARSAKLRWTGY